MVGLLNYIGKHACSFNPKEKQNVKRSLVRVCQLLDEFALKYQKTGSFDNHSFEDAENMNKVCITFISLVFYAIETQELLPGFKSCTSMLGTVQNQSVIFLNEGLKIKKLFI